MLAKGFISYIYIASLYVNACMHAWYLEERVFCAFDKKF